VEAGAKHPASSLESDVNKISVEGQRYCVGVEDK